MTTLRLLSSVLVLILSAQAWAISGRVIDENGKPLAGVIVSLQGNESKDTTNADGLFGIDITTAIFSPRTAPAHILTHANSPLIFDMRGRQAYACFFNSSYQKLPACQILISTGTTGSAQTYINGVSNTPLSHPDAARSPAPALRKALAVVDTAVFVKPGYATRKIPVSSYDEQLGDVVLQSQSADGWVQLFNGVDFTGWWIMGNAYFDVKDGEIRATKDGIQSGGYLMTKKDDFMDFELKCEVYCDYYTDSGIALRDVCTDTNSTRGDGWHCCVDYRPGGPLGGFYYKDRSEEYAYWKGTWPFKIETETTIKLLNTSKTTVKQFITNDDWQTVFKPKGWNEIRIRFTGEKPLYECWMNGTKIVEWQCSTKDADDNGWKPGKIGFQVVQDRNWQEGKWVKYRNVFVKEL